MGSQIRLVGYIVFGAGVLIALSYVITPLRFLVNWLVLLPVPLKIGLGAATFGLVLLFVSLLSERWADRSADAALKEDHHKPPSP